MAGNKVTKLQKIVLPPFYTDTKQIVLKTVA